MPKENEKPVENKDPKAGEGQGKPVENNDSNAGGDQKQKDGEIDYEKEFNELLPKFIKTQEERDNYKNGLLKKKGKLPADPDEGEGEDQETLDDKIATAVAAAMQQTEQAQTQKRILEIAENAIKENKELKIALQNKTQVPNTPTGSEADGGNNRQPKPNDNLVSAEQVAFFKKQGKSDAWIERYKQNYARKLSSNK